MYFIPDDALLRLRQMRKRKLQLGGRLTGHDARLRGNDDAVCTVCMLRHCLSPCHRVRAPDLH